MPCLLHHSASPLAALPAALPLTAPVQPARAKRIYHNIEICSHIAERASQKTGGDRFIS